MLKRISTGVAQSSLSRSYMGKAGLDDEAEAYGETRGHSARQPVFLNLQGLCADSPKRTGVAHPEGSLGSEPQRVGGVDLW